MDNLTLTWSDRASSDLETILTRIAYGDPYAPSKLLPNPEAAERLGNDIIKALERLEKFPNIGKPFDKNENGPIYEIPCRHYRIFFHIFEHQGIILLLHIRSGVRDEPDF